MTSDPQVPPEPTPHPTAERARLPGARGMSSRGKEPMAVPPKSAVPFTKTAAAWWALIVGVLILIVLLIFIAQNLDSRTIQFLGWRWNAPTGIALLVAAICGSLITVLTGAARMVQLRRVAKKNLRGPNPPRP